MKLEKVRPTSLIAIILTLAALFIFTYRLGYTSLQPYDEAWYGSISFNIIETGQPFKLIFNGRQFTDHPPAGFWLMALSQLIFGPSEFSVRFTSAVTGALSIYFLYRIGESLFNRKVGLYSALMLFSSLWFVLRARSGNLDIPLIFFYLLTIYFIINKRFYPAIISTAVTVMIKTLVGWSILPILLLALYSNRKQINLSRLLLATGVSTAIILPWYFINIGDKPNLLRHQIFNIGLRGRANSIASFRQLKKSLVYLRSGIGKWYRIGLVATAISWIKLLGKRASDKNKKLLLVYFWLILVAFPFLISTETEVWHLLPIYPPIFLISAFLLWSLEDLLKHKCRYVYLIIPVFVIGVFIHQFPQVFKLAIPQTKSTSDEELISRELKKYSGKYHLKSWFYPAAVYYSHQQINPLFASQNSLELSKNLIDNDQKDVFVVDNQEVEIFQQMGANLEYSTNSYSIMTDY